MDIITLAAALRKSSNEIDAVKDELTNELAIEEVNIECEYFSVCRLVRYGKVKTITLQTTLSTKAMETTLDYVKYFTLPDSFKPYKVLLTRFTGLGSDGLNSWAAKIDTNGDFSLFNANQKTRPSIAQTIVYI